MYLCIYTWRLTKATAKMKDDTEQTKKMYKVGSECEMNSRPEGSVG